MLDACRDNPFAPTMQRTMALKLVDKGFSNIEPGAGFMVVYAAKHGETALDGEGATARSRPRSRATSRSRMSRCESCSTSSATTSGPRPSTSSSPSPTARRRGARIFISWRGSSSSSLRDEHCDGAGAPGLTRSPACPEGGQCYFPTLVKLLRHRLEELRSTFLIQTTQAAGRSTDRPIDDAPIAAFAGAFFGCLTTECFSVSGTIPCIASRGQPQSCVACC